MEVMKGIIFGVVCLCFMSSWCNHDTELKVLSAEKYCKANDLDTNFCVLIDMSIHSGKKRLYVYDFTKDSVLYSGLVSHGCGKKPWSDDHSKGNPLFSNIPESHMSSLGKYRIGKRGWSNWGIHVNYKLHGLERTNSKAYERLIVLHGWSSVQDSAVYPQGTPEGYGCPAVSNAVMTHLDRKLKGKSKDVLLWIYQ